MTDRTKNIKREPAADGRRDDSADLAARVAVRLVQIERGKRLRRRLKRSLLFGLLLVLAVGGGLLAWKIRGEDMLRTIPLDLEHWPVFRQ